MCICLCTCNSCALLLSLAWCECVCVCVCLCTYTCARLSVTCQLSPRASFFDAFRSPDLCEEDEDENTRSLGKAVACKVLALCMCARICQCIQWKQFSVTAGPGRTMSVRAQSELSQWRRGESVGCSSTVQRMNRYVYAGHS